MRVAHLTWLDLHFRLSFLLAVQHSGTLSPRAMKHGPCSTTCSTMTRSSMRGGGFCSRKLLSGCVPNWPHMSTYTHTHTHTRTHTYTNNQIHAHHSYDLTRGILDQSTNFFVCSLWKWGLDVCIGCRRRWCYASFHGISERSRHVHASPTRQASLVRVSRSYLLCEQHCDVEILRTVPTFVSYKMIRARNHYRRCMNTRGRVSHEDLSALNPNILY